MMLDRTYSAAEIAARYPEKQRRVRVGASNLVPPKLGHRAVNQPIDLSQQYKQWDKATDIEDHVVD